MAHQKYRTFAEFWTFYVTEHSLPATRWLHFIGTSTGAVLAIVGVATGMWWLVPVGVVSGYGPAWIGHFFVEKNRPASFKQPIYSFMGDWKMLAYMVTGRMDAELARARRIQETSDAPPSVELA